MTASNMDLWQLVQALRERTPFTTNGVEALFGPLQPREQAGDGPFAFYKGGPVALKDGTKVAEVDLRVRKTAGSPSSFLVLSLEGTCVTLASVREHYAELKITQTPRGRSLDEETSHTSVQPWGRLSFGFKERNPKCLSSIAFDPKN